MVKNITKLNEESKHSQADNTEKSQSTEVDIKVRICGVLYLSKTFGNLLTDCQCLCCFLRSDSRSLFRMLLLESSLRSRKWIASVQVSDLCSGFVCDKELILLLVYKPFNCFWTEVNPWAAAMFQPSRNQVFWDTSALHIVHHVEMTHGKAVIFLRTT